MFCLLDKCGEMPDKIVKLLSTGSDTILTNDYLMLSNALGIK